MGAAAGGVVAGLGVISTSVDNILTSGDKAEIAKYQAQGDIAKANAIIAQAQAKADADAKAAAEKEKSQKTLYIIIGVVFFLLIIILVVVLTRKPTQSVPYYPQYQIQKPTMPTNYVQPSPPPRQLQPIARKA